MDSKKENLLYAIALSQVEGIGPVLARKLIQEIGTPKAVFQESSRRLLTIEGMGSERVRVLRNSKTLQRAEKELNILERNNWQAHYFKESEYPRRLRNAIDAPLVLFQKGRADLNPRRAISIVGSRKMTEAGKGFIESMGTELGAYNLQVISGLAYGVDGMAHRTSLLHNISNIAVVAHGLERVYPSLHRTLAQKIIDAGGAIVTEFLSGSLPDRENFPKRNRIIAGMSDAVIVIEAAKKGGALITADLANQYNRDVFAVPGEPGQVLREGCNLLIKSHRANLLESLRDLEYVMRWSKSGPSNAKKSYEGLSEDDRNLLELLGESGTVKDLDWLCEKSTLKASELLSRLVMLELEGYVNTLAGNRYSLLY